MKQDGIDAAEAVAAVLENYARRGIFRGFSRGTVRSGKASFRMVWHHDQVFDLVLDLRKARLRIPLLLPDVPSRMYADLREFVRSRQSDELPEHRRIDPERAAVRLHNRSGSVSITMTAPDGSLEYATRKLIHLVHEIFLTFLQEGIYFEYAVDKFGLNPEGM
ncbi:MAG: hypothetical protein IPM66_01970 [Acidobacteriota bacterium]|nr:MAG: hypothetical protein IPM66_01970 [Acidobacteriota bacterium]